VGVADRSVLIVIADADETVERASRNLPWAKVIRAGGLNVYDVLRHAQLLFTRPGLEAVQERLGGAAKGGEA